MAVVLDGIVSEFETVEAELLNNDWLRAKLEASLADNLPLVPHDVVMAELDAIINEYE